MDWIIDLINDLLELGEYLNILTLMSNGNYFLVKETRVIYRNVHFHKYSNIGLQSEYNKLRFGPTIEKYQ